MEDGAIKSSPSLKHSSEDSKSNLIDKKQKQFSESSSSSSRKSSSSSSSSQEKHKHKRSRHHSSRDKEDRRRRRHSRSSSGNNRKDRHKDKHRKRSSSSNSSRKRRNRSHKKHDERHSKDSRDNRSGSNLKTKSNKFKNFDNEKRPEDFEPGSLKIEETKTDPKLAMPNSRAGGVYIPPWKMEKMMNEIKSKDKNSKEYQKYMWEQLRKSINGLINKVNVSNIQNIILELFNENLIRGRGLLTKAIFKAQMASPNFTHVYAAL